MDGNLAGSWAGHEALAPLGRALLDHHRGRRGETLAVRYESGEEDRRAVAVFFRGEADLDPLERRALELCGSRVLDVGAAAGAHSLPLVARGHEVTALELLPAAATVLRERGVPRVVEGDLWTVELTGPFDTVLALMNGTGLAGTRRRLPALLARLAELGGPGCRVLVDSTAPDDADDPEEPGAAETQIQLEYRGRRGPPFPHLFVDPSFLGRAARAAGLTVDAVDGDPDGYFLARLRAPA